MFSKIRLLLALPLLLLLVGVTQAQDVDPLHSEPYWQVTFWNNSDLAGEPVLTSSHQTIDWNWGYGSPDPVVQRDQFSIRWNRYIQESSGTYRFTAISDDGLRVYVDNQLIIDEWRHQPATTFVADVPLTAGHHLIVVEYFEHAGLAQAKLSWEPLPLPDPVHFWRGEYYSNAHLQGMPELVRDDRTIDYNWGYGSPSPVVPTDHFSIRWTRIIHFEPGEYRFTTTTDDGVRLWVDGHLLIDRWQNQTATSHSGTIFVSGDVTLKMEYFEDLGAAVAKLRWEQAVNPPPPPPSPHVVIVDDDGPGFVRGGSTRGWRTASGGYGGQFMWTQNVDRIRPEYNWARWYPRLEAGRYEVSVYIPERYATTRQARYWVSHYDGLTLRVVNQGAVTGWVSLGTYHFQSGDNDYVSLADVTFEPYLSRYVGFDAVKWVRQ